MGTGQSVDKEDVHGPLSMAVQGRVPPYRGNILAKDESLDISGELRSKY